MEKIAVYKIWTPRMPWGDYGRILLSGMTAHLGRKRGRLQLERTGPFVPPISFPGIGDIVVTDHFKNLLETSNLTGLAYQPVIKAHIVALDWEKWDRNLPEPYMYPNTPDQEPEDYILGQPHSPDLAARLGRLWELCLEEVAEIERGPEDPQTGLGEIYLKLSTWDGRDWFRARGVAYNYISDKAKTWLEETAPEWVRLEPVRVH